MKNKLTKFLINDLPDEIEVHGVFDKTCFIYIGEESMSSILNFSLKIKISSHPKGSSVSNFIAKIEMSFGNIDVIIHMGNSNLEMGTNSQGIYQFLLSGASKIAIGQNTTSHGIKVFCDNSEFICGEDCMFSESIVIQTNDQHGIINIENGLIINNTYKFVHLGNHVWLARGCSLTPGASIGSGSVVGMGSVVANKISENTIVAGNPAKIIKTNHTWSRFTNSLDNFCIELMKKVPN